MDQISLLITFLTGESREVEVTAGDVVAYELRFEKSIDDISLATHFYYLAWHSETRTKNTAKSFEEWINEVRQVTPANPKGSKA